MQALHVLAIIFGFPIAGVGIALVVKSCEVNNISSLEERRIRLIGSMNGLNEQLGEGLVLAEEAGGKLGEIAQRSLNAACEMRQQARDLLTFNMEGDDELNRAQKLIEAATIEAQLLRVRSMAAVSRVDPIQRQLDKSSGS